jgi:hypothetical protein
VDRSSACSSATNRTSTRPSGSCAPRPPSNKARTALEDRLSAEIDGAVEAAEQAPDEPVEDLLKYVTSPVGVSRP